jgi:hypothetical protein
MYYTIIYVFKGWEDVKKGSIFVAVLVKYILGKKNCVFNVIHEFFYTKLKKNLATPTMYFSSAC